MTKENIVQPRLLFGVDSMCRVDNILQNNLTEFEWVIRNKRYPDFWGRHLNGENCLTADEIIFIHSKGCRIAPIYQEAGDKLTADHGRSLAHRVKETALSLHIPKGTAIFLNVGEENISTEFMAHYAESLLDDGYVPAFKASTDAAYPFDREYSRGMQIKRPTFEKCLIWATAPTLPEFNRVTTTHVILPELWVPFAPSGITRGDIAVWQYGKECHAIHDNAGAQTYFNVDLVKNNQIITQNMF